MLHSKKYCCVAFDAVGTLIHATPSVAEAYQQIGRKYGCQLELNEIQSRFQRVFGARQLAETTNERKEFQFWQDIVSEVIGDVDKADDCFDDLYQHFGKSESWSVIAQAEETIEQLLAAGIQVAVASNFDARLHTVLDGKPVLRKIAIRVISSKIGWRKPSPHFYQALTDQARCSASEILMIGDDLQNDVIAATESGIDALHYVADGTPSIEGVQRIRSLDQVLHYF